MHDRASKRTVLGGNQWVYPRLNHRRNPRQNSGGNPKGYPRGYPRWYPGGYHKGNIECGSVSSAFSFIFWNGSNIIGECSHSWDKTLSNKYGSFYQPLTDYIFWETALKLYKSENLKNNLIFLKF